MAKTKKVAEKKSEPATYRVEIILNNETTKFEGNDLLSLLRGFKVPDFIKTRTVITVWRGDKTETKSFDVFDARRLFANSAAQEVLVGDLKELLG